MLGSVSSISAPTLYEAAACLVMEVMEKGAFLSGPSPGDVFASVVNGSAAPSSGVTRAIFGLIGLKGGKDAALDVFARDNPIAAIAPERTPLSVIALSDFLGDGEPVRFSDPIARANPIAVIAPDRIPCSVIALSDFLGAGETVRFELEAARESPGFRTGLGLLDA